MAEKTGKSLARPSLLELLHRASQRADERFLSSRGNSTLRPRQYSVLRVLALQPDVSQTDLVEQTGIDRSTMADIMRRLINRGLVQRRRTRSDARMYAVRLTPSGLGAVAVGEHATRQVEATLTSRLNARERAQLADLLTRVVDAHPEPARPTVGSSEKRGRG